MKTLADIVRENVERSKQTAHQQVTAVQSARAAAEEAAPVPIQGPLPMYLFHHRKDAGALEDFQTHAFLFQREGLVKFEPVCLNDVTAVEQALAVIEGGTPLLVVMFMTSQIIPLIDPLQLLEKSELARSTGQQCFVSVVVKECDWMSTGFGRLMAVPEYAKPVKKWSDQDAAWADVVRRLRETITEMRKKI